MALLYADNFTDSMKKAIYETERRRSIQYKYNKKNNITPMPAGKKANNSILSFLELSRRLQKEGVDNSLVDMSADVVEALKSKDSLDIPIESLPQLIDDLEKKMKILASNLEFEQAAKLRDQIHQLRKKLLK